MTGVFFLLLFLFEMFCIFEGYMNKELNQYILDNCKLSYVPSGIANFAQPTALLHNKSSGVNYYLKS